MTTEQKVVIYRIVQESLNNAAKHSKATTIMVSLWRIDDQIELVIRDNGRGFDPEDVNVRPSGNKGLGLASIRARALFAGGTHALRSAVGQGVEIRVTLPLALNTPDTGFSCRSRIATLRAGANVERGANRS